MTEERRKEKRYPIQEPVMLTARQNGHDAIHGITENVSMSGILLSTESQIPQQTRVNLIIKMSHRNSDEVGLLSCGKVVRVETRCEGGSIIAVECDDTFEAIAERR